MRSNEPELPKSNFQSDARAEYGGKQELKHSELGLKKYNDSLLLQLTPTEFILKKPIGIVDFGAGNGTLASIFRERLGILPICVEIDPELIEELNLRGFEVKTSLLDLKGKNIDFLYTSNVLEHIEDDFAPVKQIYEILAPNGYFAVFVPALPFLYARFDSEVGHFRRYRRKDLLKLIESAGFKVISISYFDSLGVLTWLIVKITGFRPASPRTMAFSMRFYDQIVFPISRLLDNLGFSRIVGKNLVVVSQKQDLSEVSQK
jgi:SAM-dependent methyltransferase